MLSPCAIEYPLSRGAGGSPNTISAYENRLISAIKMHILSNTFFRFLLSGGLNTAVTYLLYLLLMIYLPYWAAYSISFLAGMLFSYVMNCKFVFRAHRGVVSLLGLPMVYLVQYIFGGLLLWLWVGVAEMDASVGPLFVVCVTFPVTFVLTRYVFVARH